MEYICLSTVSVAEFYKQLCYILGVSNKGGKPGMFKAIQEQIWYLYHEKRQPLFLAVDEAQYLSTGILNDIKMLMNYGYDSVNSPWYSVANPISIALSGALSMKRYVKGLQFTTIIRGSRMKNRYPISFTSWSAPEPQDQSLMMLSSGLLPVMLMVTHASLITS